MKLFKCLDDDCQNSKYCLRHTKGKGEYFQNTPRTGKDCNYFIPLDKSDDKVELMDFIDDVMKKGYTVKVLTPYPVFFKATNKEDSFVFTAELKLKSYWSPRNDFNKELEHMFCMFSVTHLKDKGRQNVT